MIVGMIIVMTACGGGGGGGGGDDGSSYSSGNNSIMNSFVRKIPVNSSSYYNTSNGESASLLPFHRSALADDGEILQLPSLANNVFQDWWADECQIDYDVARPDEIWMNPFLGGTKKLVVGESYHLIAEVGRLEQMNPCSYGRAVTGEWDFVITNTSHGEPIDNVNVWSRYETGEFVIEILDNGTDYSETVTVEITFYGQDYNGAITGTVEFEIIKEHSQMPKIDMLMFHDKLVEKDEEVVIDFFKLPDVVNIQAIGDNISTTSWISSAGVLSSGLLDGDTWAWGIAKIAGRPMILLVNIENDDHVLIQKKILVYGAEQEIPSPDDDNDASE